MNAMRYFDVSGHGDELAAMDLHQRIVNALLRYVVGSQGGFGELVSQIMCQLEDEGPIPEAELDEWIDQRCQEHVSAFGDYAARSEPCFGPARSFGTVRRLY